MTRPVAVLAGVDAQIFDLLLHVVAIGKHRGTWRAADVARVCRQHLGPREPSNADLRRRVIAAERRAREYREQRDRAIRELRLRQDTDLWRPDPPNRIRMVELNPRYARLLGEVSRGRLIKDVAPEVGIKANTASNVVTRITKQVGAMNPRHLISMVVNGEVEVRVRREGKRAA